MTRYSEGRTIVINTFEDRRQRNERRGSVLKTVRDYAKTTSYGLNAVKNKIKRGEI